LLIPYGINEADNALDLLQYEAFISSELPRLLQKRGEVLEDL
jgi:hypothetical protein